MNLYIFLQILVFASAADFDSKIKIVTLFRVPIMDENGDILLKESDYRGLRCLSNRNYILPGIKIHKIKNLELLNAIRFSMCTAPDRSFAEIINLYEIIDPTAFKRLHLNLHGYMELNRIYFENLKIEELNIQNIGSPLNIKLSNDFLEPLQTLKFLRIDNIIAFPPLPDHTNLRNLSLENGMSLAEFGGCNLDKLYLKSWEVPKESGNWLRNCTKLTELEIENMSFNGIRNVLIAGNNTLQRLSIRKIHLLSKIPYQLLTGATDLRYIQITESDIGSVEKDVMLWLDSLKNLEVLDLSGNILSRWLNVLTLSTSRNMKYISLADNPRTSMCTQYNNYTIYFDFTNLSIQNFNLSGTGVEICFPPLITMKNLEYLDLRNNNISVLKFGNLPQTSINRYIADLRENQIQEILFTENDFNAIKYNDSQKNVTVLIDSQLDCDCQFAWVARGLREGLLSFDTTLLTTTKKISTFHTIQYGAKCSDNIDLREKPLESLECNKTFEDGCVFRKTWSDGLVVAKCGGANIKDLPQGKKFKEIHASNNSIEIIRTDDLPSTLQYLDLRHNNIFQIDEDVAGILFNNFRRLLLRGNPILCNCYNKYFIEQFQTHYLQVDDYENMTCAGEQTLLLEKNPEDLCTVFPLRQVSSSITGICLLVLVYVMFRVYREDIKIFLFTHGWCLWCVQEEDLDADRPFDAFISFSHMDNEFVAEKLLIGLEPDHKCCVHYRNWIIGEWIPLQIQLSIQASKRTIIVLSKNYLKSIWGLFEFRMAYASAVKEGRSRIIVIVLDDVIDDAMEPDLRHFVSNNTYLECGDPWFWQKLRYVLPHKRIYTKNYDECNVVQHQDKNNITKQELPMLICAINEANVDVERADVKV